MVRRARGSGAHFPLRDVSHVSAVTDPSLIPPSPSLLPAKYIVWGLHAGSLSLTGLQMRIHV